MLFASIQKSSKIQKCFDKCSNLQKIRISKFVCIISKNVRELQAILPSSKFVQKFKNCSCLGNLFENITIFAGITKKYVLKRLFIISEIVPVYKIYSKI